MLAQKLDRESVAVVDLGNIREKISLFGGLNDAQMNILLPHVKTRALTCGEVVFNQGQLPCNVYIVLQGRVSMEVAREDGSFASVDFVAGDCFGETAVIGIQPQLGCVIAQEDCQLLVLSRTCLMTLVDQDPELFGIVMMNIAREVSRRLHSFVAAPSAGEHYPIVRA